MGEKFGPEFYLRILDQVHSNIFITDTETDEIIYMNKAMKKAYNLPEPEGKLCWQALQEGMSERCEFCKIDELEYYPWKKGRKWRQYNTLTGKTYMNFGTLEEWNGKIYYVQNSVDITDHLQLSVEATIDELTTLLNRQAGRKRLEDTLKHMGKEEQFVVALYDVNGLKWVNDTYGHLEGDKLLHFISTRLKKEISDPDFMFRLSGDEFIIVFMNQEIPQVDRRMKKMLAILEQEKSDCGIEYNVSFSYGLAKVRGGEHLGVSDVLSIADTQMYVQKRDYHIKRETQRFHINEGERNKDKKEFKYSQEYLFDAFSESVSGYAFIGNLKTGEFMYSANMVKDFGLPKQVLSEATVFWGERIHPEDRELFLRSNQEIADGKADRHTITYRAKNAKGVWVQLLCKGKMIRDADGNPDLFAGVISDLDRREAWKELRGADEVSFYFVDKRRAGETAEMEGKLLSFVNRNIPGGIMAFYDEPEYPLVCFNQALLEYTNSTYEDLVQKTEGKYSKLVYEEDRAMVEKEIRKQLEEKEMYEIYYRIMRNDESFLWVYAIGRYAVNENGERYILSFLTDATEKMEREAELRHTEQLYQYVCNHTQIHIWEFDIKERKIIIPYSNESKKTRVIENVPENIIAQNRIYPDSIETFRNGHLRVINGEENVVMTVQIIKKDGTTQWEKITYTSLKNEDGETARAVGISEDVTIQKEAEIRIFNEEKMHEIMSDDMLYSFRLNLTRNSLESAWDKKGIKIPGNLSHVKYEDIYERILATIENKTDRKRFENYYFMDNIKKYADRDSFVREFELRQRDHDGTIVWVNLCYKIIASPHNGDKILFAYARNIDLLKRRELSLPMKAEIDAVSGLYNPVTTKLLMENMVNNKNEWSEESAFILIDIDSFEGINCIGGAAMGDDILHQMGEIIKWKVNSTCIAGRLIHDTFAVYYYDIESKKAVREEIAEIKNALTGKYICDGKAINLTVSIGAVYVFGQNSTYGQIFQKAQYALDAVKKKGGDDLLFYDDIKEEMTKGEIGLKGTGLDPARERTVGGFEKTVDKELADIFCQALLQIENGESKKNVYEMFLEYMGRIYRAEEVTLYKKCNTKEGLCKEAGWNAFRKGSTYHISKESTILIEQILEEYSFTNYILIDGKDSKGYEEMCRIYGVDSLDYPVFLSGFYEGEKLTYCMLIEKGEPDLISAELAETVLEMIQRTEAVYGIRNEYEHILHYDRNTGVKNYESYMERIDAINEDTLITFGMVGVRMVDLKEYNKRYGNAKGDESVRFVSALLSELFGKENCYRVRRTSFFVLCDNMAYENFFEKYHRLEAETEKVYLNWIVTANVWEQHTISVERMQEQLEEKLMVARNKKRINEGEVSDRTILEVLKNIREAIEKGNLYTYLQPKADADTKKICGAEALIRYCDEEKGMLPPGKFLPPIEKSGLIRHIDLFVLKDVCRMIKKWIAEGWEPFPISLNYSRKTILEPGILEETNLIVESYGIPKELIEIEITESVTSIDSTSLKNIVKRFRSAGYRIALDDYGAEYSNVYALYSLQLSTVKLDRHVINDIYYDEKAKIVVENVIDICKKFHITSVAEGIETEEQFEVLKELSCDVIQGYYINKPLPEEEFYNLYLNEA